LLESALARPRQLLAYGKPTMPELAAAYVAGIVRNHPFVDGNKRTGFMMGAGFLERNGWEFLADEADAVIQTLALAANASSQEQYASWLGINSKRLKG
jgi:death-on-curing protein